MFRLPCSNNSAARFIRISWMNSFGVQLVQALTFVNKSVLLTPNSEQKDIMSKLELEMLSSTMDSAFFKSFSSMDEVTISLAAKRCSSENLDLNLLDESIRFLTLSSNSLILKGLLI